MDKTSVYFQCLAKQHLEHEPPRKRWCNKSTPNQLPPAVVAPSTFIPSNKIRLGDDFFNQESSTLAVSLLDIPEHYVVTLTPTEKEFSDFNSFVRKAYNDHAPNCGGILMTPTSSFNNYIADLKSLQNEIAAPYEQIYKKHGEGVYLLEDEQQAKVTYWDFHARSNSSDLEKAGDLELGGRTPFWQTMLTIFNTSLQQKTFPHYVVDKEGTLFPRESSCDWHMYSLKETITPLMKKVVAIPGVNTTQLMFGEVQSFTSWHVEDENLLRFILFHISVPARYGDRLKKLMKETLPEYYEMYDNAEFDKGIALMPQLLKACDPPIPFHCIKQGKGDYVITFPGAFHFVVNAGVNVAEATNFAIPEWVPFAGKAGKCTCDHRKGKKAVQSYFIKM